jgi:hypothetical protein
MQNEPDSNGNNKSNDLDINNEDEDTPIDNTENDGSEDPGSELDSISEYNKKRDLEKEHPKPQADETLNPDLTTDNDI